MATRSSLKYVQSPSEDQHGKVRTYFLRPPPDGDGKKKEMHSALHAQGDNGKWYRTNEGSDEFLAEYAALRAGKVSAPEPTPPKPQPIRKGKVTVRQLYDDFLGSPACKELDPKSQKHHIREANRFCQWIEERGNPLADELEFDNLEAYLETLSKGTHNQAIKTMRVAWRQGIRKKLVKLNPTHDLEYNNNHTPHHTWSWEEVEKFRKHWDIGTKPRLALELFFWTGQRRSDVIRMGPKWVGYDGFMHFIQAKNARRNPIEHASPISTYLQRVIDQTITGEDTFLTTNFREWQRHTTNPWKERLDALIEHYGNALIVNDRYAAWSEAGQRSRGASGTGAVTIMDLFKELRAEGYDGSYDAIADYVHTDRGRVTPEVAARRLLPKGPYDIRGFAKSFEGWVRAAGLPTTGPKELRCTPHGLRYALATMLADLGLSAHVIKAVTGHRTLKEVERYTAKADQKRLALQAMAALTTMHEQAGLPTTNIVSLLPGSRALTDQEKAEVDTVLARISGQKVGG